MAVQSNKVYLPQEVLLVSTDLALRQINAIRFMPIRLAHQGAYKPFFWPVHRHGEARFAKVAGHGLCEKIPQRFV